MSIICNERSGQLKRTIAAALIGAGGLLLATQALATESYGQLQDFVNYLKQGTSHHRLNFVGAEGGAPYSLTVHSAAVVPLLKGELLLLFDVGNHAQCIREGLRHTRQGIAAVLARPADAGQDFTGYPFLIGKGLGLIRASEEKVKPLL